MMPRATHPTWRGTYAFLMVGTRLYSFTMPAPGSEKILEALLSTVQFRS